MFEEVLHTGLETITPIAAIEVERELDPTDEQVVRAVLAGDTGAFETIFERHRRMVTRVVSRFFRERSDIEEFVQQAFTKCYFSLKHYRGSGGYSFPAWLTRIAVNVCYDEFRRRQRVAEVNTTGGDGSDGTIDIPDGAAGPDTSLAAVELAEKVLSALDARDRVAMTLVYAEDYSLAEAAEVLGISSSNLKSRLFRCRSMIKQRFGHLL
jgi:RNA polymerase sigma-70 factor (ECF subfamily)